MLLSLLGPGSLQLVKSVTIDRVSVNGDRFMWYLEQTWLDARGLTEATALAMVSEGLLALPSLEDFLQGDTCSVEGWVKKIAVLHPDHWLGRHHKCGRSHYHRVR